MKCDNCQTEYEPGNAFCPKCGQPSAEQPEVVEAELIDDGRLRQADFHEKQGAQSGYRQIIYTNFSRSMSGSSGCMPVSVTLFLALIAFLAYGFLAGLGFLFFSAVGLGLTFFVFIKRIFSGKSSNFLLMAILTWAVSWLLVAWMSGAFAWAT